MFLLIQVLDSSEQFDQSSVEYLQNQRPPSPAEHIGHSRQREDTHSAGGDSGSVASSRKRYGSFATKSTSSSMYNYAEFGASTEDGRGQAVRGVRADKQYSGFEKSMEGMTFGGSRAEDDEFEHLDADEVSDSDTEDHINKSVAVDENAGSSLTSLEDKDSEPVESKSIPNESVQPADIRTQEGMQVDVHNTDDNAECV